MMSGMAIGRRDSLTPGRFPKFARGLQRRSPI
jgi:hypothetical protein